MSRPLFTALRAGIIASGLALIILFINGCGVTPKPFTPQELQEHSEKDLKTLFEDQEPVSGAIDLYEAMSRAVAFNLDYRVKSLEEALARGNLVRAGKEMLPQLLTSAGYTTRNNDNISVSKTITTGVTSTDPSTSQDKQIFNADIITVWNLLDFGVAYTQAQQTANEVIIANERRRRSLQNIVQDIRQAYFRAVSAERLLPEMDGLLARVEKALAKSRRAEKAKLQEPAKILEYQQELLETVQQLWSMRRDLSLAKTELANLMNLKPGMDYSLVLPPEHVDDLPEPQQLVAAELEQAALTGRPEIRIEAYQGRISALEVRKAMLRMLPGLEMSLGANFDSNSYLVNNVWTQIGSRLSWNAFSLLSGPAAVTVAELQEQLAADRHLFMSMMVLTQVNLALQRYHLAGRELGITSELAEVLERRLAHAQAARKAKKGNELEEIRQQAAFLAARMRRGVALAEYQSAFGRLVNSTGTDPLPDGYGDPKLMNLSQAFREQEAKLFEQVINGRAKSPQPPEPVTDDEIEQESKASIIVVRPDSAPSVLPVPEDLVPDTPEAKPDTMSPPLPPIKDRYAPDSSFTPQPPVKPEPFSVTEPPINDEQPIPVKPEISTPPAHPVENPQQPTKLEQNSVRINSGYVIPDTGDEPGVLLRGHRD